MAKQDSITRLSYIINKLKVKPCSFDELEQHLSNKFELREDLKFKFSLRTFQRDINEIATLYNIHIYYDNKERVYKIEEGYVKNDYHERMLEAFDMYHALKLTDEFPGIVIFDKRKAQGSHNMYGIIHAIRNKLSISFSYERYYEQTSTNRVVEPYALKEFELRWYVVGFEEGKDTLITFALDRISELYITSNRFKRNKTVDVEEKFKHFYGIMTEDKEPCVVKLSFTPEQGKYVQSLPLHHSQRTIKNNKEELLIELLLFPTYDFKMHLLSLGNNVKVIKPKSLANEIKKMHQMAMERYLEK